MMLDKWYSSKKIREILNISSQCLYYMKRSGRIEYKQISDKKFVYKLPESFIGENQPQVAIYARVSTTKQKADLDNQVNKLKEYIVANGDIVNPDLVFTDIASGMNENRQSLELLISEVMAGHVSKVVISNRDRLTRFGFGYFKNLFERFNCEIIEVNMTDESTFEQELTNDLITIIHQFSTKYYGGKRDKMCKIETELHKEMRSDDKL